MEILNEEQQEKFDKGLCIVKGCNNKHEKYRKICYRCKQNLYKLRHPVAYHYNELRKKARRRHIEFGITFEEFERFCLETDYIWKCGRTSDNASIDRVINEIGYFYHNIQVLSVSANSSKGTSDYDEWFDDYKSKNTVVPF